MKKIVMILLGIFSFMQVANATTDYMVCFNDNTVCHESDEVNSIIDNEDFGSLISKGNSYIKVGNSNFVNMEVLKNMTLELSGTNTFESIYFNSDININIVGNGTLKVKEIGIALGGADLVIYPTANTDKISDYFTGDYEVSTSADYVIITGKTAVEKRVLDTPTLSANINSDGTLTLTPNVVEEDVSYLIYRSTKSTSGYKKIIGSDNCGGSHVDSDVIPGKTYYYKIKTYYEDAEGTIYSNYSDAVKVKATLNSPEATVSSINKTTLKVKWDKVEGASGYQVYRATSKNGKYTLVKTTTSTSYINKNLTTGKRYYYKVRAYKTVSGTKGYSSFGEAISAIPKVAAPSYTVTSYNYNANKIVINKVSGASGYVIYRALGDEGYIKIATTTSTTYVDKGLAVGKEYNYKIRAYATVSRSKKYGDFGNIVPCTPTVRAPKVTIDNTKSRDSLQIDIEKTSGATSYNIYKYNGTEFVHLINTTSLSFVDTSVEYGKEYTYKVQALREIESTENPGFYSAEVSATVKPATLDLLILNEEYNKQLVKWHTLDQISEDDEYTFYLYRSTKSTSGFELIYEGNAFEYEVTGLSFNKTYYYKAVIELNGVKSEYSTVFYRKTALSAPYITANYGSKSSIKVSYDKVEGATGYVIYRATSLKGKYTAIKTTTSTSFTDSGLTAGKTYYYKVRAYRTVSGKKYYSGYSNYDSEKPRVGVPTFTVQDYTYNSNKIAITKVSGASGYAIYRSDAEDGPYSLLTVTTSRTYYDKKLETGKTYYYKVKAYSLVGKSKKYGDLSSPKSATPVLGDAAFAIVATDSAYAVTLNIFEVSGATGYKIYRTESNLENYELITDTADLFYVDTTVQTGKSYTYKVVAYRTVGENNVESTSFMALTKEVKPDAPIIKVNRKDETTQTVRVELNEYETGHDVKIAIYASVNNGEYQILTETSEILESDGVYYIEYENSNLTLGNTISYKAIVKVDEISSTYSNIGSKMVTYDAKEAVVMIDTEDTKYVIAFLENFYTYDGIEVYRSTTKTGLYNLVATDYGEYVRFASEIGKTHYYKIRYYNDIDGTKVYSEFSEAVKYTQSLESITSLPCEKKASSYNYRINSVSFSLSDSTETTMTYKVKLNLNSYSTKERTVTIKLEFMPSFGDETTKMYYLTYKVTLPKGTKNNWSKTATITLPNHYSHFGIVE